MYNIWPTEDMSIQLIFLLFVSHWQYNRFREKFNIPEYKCFVIKNATHAFKEDRINTAGRIKLIYTSTPWRGLSV